MKYEKQLNRITCDTLRKNTQQYLQLFLDSGIDPQTFFKTNDLEAKFAEKFDADAEDFNSLKIYKELMSEISSKHQIPSQIATQLESNLELIAFTYIAIAQISLLRRQLSPANDLTKRVAHKVTSLEKILTEDKEALSILMDTARFGEASGRDYSEIIDQTLGNLKLLKFIHSDFQNSKLSEITKFNSKSPNGNPGLFQWTTLIYYIWINRLDRTLENKRDGINGRKHLLEFIFDCMQPIHPALEYETLDNMLRKVQRSQQNPR